ncbi:preprotein translocase subunit SecG [Candidatus Uhrbacteria bacterium]|nr:preprotein translocase subunit SecG [Candidatus Uhrbacteria bacterium]
MNLALSITQATTAILLIISILLQQRGTGLSGAFGGEGNVYRTKRGVEKILFFATIIFALVFFASSLARMFVQ